MSPEAVAATAKVESDFNMDSGPCIGIMQINPSTYVEEHGRSGIDPREIHGNLRIGSKELARHYYNSRHCTTERMRLACMWGRYNGCGPHGSYVRRALDLYHEICRAEFKC